MTRSHTLSETAFKKLQQHATRRSLLHGSAKGAAGLGLASFGARQGWQPAGAAQDAVCDGADARISYGIWDAAQKPGVDAQIAAFTAKHPNISIEVQIVP